MSAASRPQYSIDEYVRLEEYANLKHEFLDGQIYAMAGGTLEHSAMATSVSTALSVQLRGRGCEVFNSDARVRVIATGLDTYPDVSVACGPIERDSGDKHAMTNPIVIVEVTSDSTEDYDRGKKLEHYKRIPSLREVVIVSHRRPHIEVHRRGSSGEWTTTEAGASERIVVESVGCALVVDEVFRAPPS
jgi:Uma2 family endonuclease